MITCAWKRDLFTGELCNGLTTELSTHLYGSFPQDSFRYVNTRTKANNGVGYGYLQLMAVHRRTKEGQTKTPCNRKIAGRWWMWVSGLLADAEAGEDASQQVVGAESVTYRGFRSSNTAPAVSSQLLSSSIRASIELANNCRKRGLADT